MKERQHLGVRKLCNATKYSRSVNLPKLWVKQNKLDVDSLIELIEMDDGSLVIRPAKA